MTHERIPAQTFPVGDSAAVASAIEVLDRRDVDIAIRLHFDGDSGEVDLEDCNPTDHAFLDGSPVFSVHHNPNKTRFYPIKETDRFFSTLVFCDDCKDLVKVDGQGGGR